MAITKRTPCVGICSTTYGDLVCRGCKRFAHEIVQWNGYDQDQQARIWERLQQLRDEVVGQHLSVADRDAYAQACREAGREEAAAAETVYTVLRGLVARQQSLAEAGLSTPDGALPALQVLREIDAEVYARSVAHYERNFKIPI